MSRVAESLALSEERFRVLVENASDLVRLHSTDGGCYYVSGSVKKLLGYTAEELIEKSPFELVHPEDLDAAKQLREELLRGVVSPVLKHRLRRSDGEYRCFEVAFMRVDDSSGAVRHYQSVGRDVTRRRELEQQLAQQAAELREQSLRDGLTELYNRRGLLEISPPRPIAIDRLISEADAHMYERKRERRAAQLYAPRDPRLDGEKRQSA